MSQKKLLRTKAKPLLPSKEKVSIYHDEIKDDKNNPIAHGFLIVPIRSRDIFIKDLLCYKERHSIPDSKLHWQTLSGSGMGRNEGCVRDWLKCLIHAMANEKYICHREQRGLKEALGVRFCAIFMRSLDDLSDDYWQWVDSGERTIKKFETLLRIGLKGGLHYFYDDNYKVLLKSFYTDAGAFHRSLDNKRIVGRLQQERDLGKIQSYVDLDRDLRIKSVKSSQEEAEDIKIANLLQLCDITLGAINFMCSKSDHKIKLSITQEFNNLLDKRRRKSGFKHSRHFKTFTISEAKIINREWKFNSLETKEDLQVLKNYKLNI